MSKKLIALVLTLMLVLTTFALADGHEPLVGEMKPEEEVMSYIQDMTGYVPTIYVMDGDITVLLMSKDLLRLRSSWDEDGNKFLLMPTVLDSETWEENALIGFSNDVEWRDEIRFVALLDVLEHIEALGFNASWDGRSINVEGIDPDPDFEDMPAIKENGKVYVPEVFACQIFYDILTHDHPWAKYQSVED